MYMYQAYNITSKWHIQHFLKAFIDIIIMYCVDFTENIVSRDMALIACYNDRRLGTFYTNDFLQHYKWHSMSHK